MQQTIEENSNTASSLPRIPPLLAKPLQLIPNVVHTKLLVTLLNHLFQQQLKEGEFDCLEGRTAAIRLIDGEVEFRFTKGRNWLVEHGGEGPLDLVISGTLYDFVQLSLGREDPDTLFFQRRIRLQGDVELGLEVKNLIYGMELDTLSIPAPLREAVKRGVAQLNRTTH